MLGVARVAWALHDRPSDGDHDSNHDDGGGGGGADGERSRTRDGGAGVMPLTVVRQALQLEATTQSCQVLVPGRIRLSSSRVGRSFRVYHASAQFTVSVWLFLTERPTGAWRTLLFKGKDDELSRTPAAFLAPDCGRVAFCVSTSSYWNDCTRSNRELPLLQWVHLALVRDERHSRIFVDGVLDVERRSAGHTLINAHPLQLGRTPQGVKAPSSDYAGAAGMARGLRFYPRALSAERVRAASPARAPLFFLTALAT